MTAPIEGLDQPPETLPAGVGRADSRLRRLSVNGQPFLIFTQRGRFADIAFDHGRMLAPEIDEGAFPEIVSTIARGVDRENELVERIGAVIYQFFTKRMTANISAEFREGQEALADGYLSASQTPQFSRGDVRDAVLAIEVGNLVSGFAQRMAIPGTRAFTAIGLAFQCLPYLFDKDVRRLLAGIRMRALSPSRIARASRNLAGPRNRVGFGCTGFCAGAAYTADGRHIHARNFDADLYLWNRAPVLALIDETPANPAWRKYAAFGTAGLIYPGGISGLNDAGLAVSLHQLSTTRYRSGWLSGSGEIAPYVEQRILREASTLDEAVDIARSLRHFAAWTVFCSDARSGEGMRIEFNGDGVRVTRSAAPLPQANHFIDPEMVERAFDASDGHFTPSFGKWMETRARLAYVTEMLARERGDSRIDTDWAIERMASNDDWALRELSAELGEALEGAPVQRSFGRTPCKAYGQLTSIARGDPERRPGADEVWMTLGERAPTSHATLLGWSVDWDGLAVTPVADRPVRRTERQAGVGRARWEESLSRYVAACVAVTRPRADGGDGPLLNRDPTEAEHRSNLARGVALLTEAIALAAEDGVEEIPYRHMRARLAHERGDYAVAAGDWDALLAIWRAQNGGPAYAGPTPSLMHPYDAALALVLSVATDDLASGGTGSPERAGRLAEARALLSGLRRKHFGDGPAHADLLGWLARIDEIETRGAAEVELPDENFITVE